MNPREAITCRKLIVARRKKHILSLDVLSILNGTSSAIVGLNGAGKTTLLKVISGAITDYQGNCFLSGTTSRIISPIERARLVAVMPQKLEVSFDISVMQFMHLSLYAQSRRSVWSYSSSPVVLDTLTVCGAMHLFDRMVSELSGGELKRILLAAALVQATPILLLDEPLAGLDPRATEEIVSLIGELKRNSKKTILCVTHDLLTVSRISDRVVALRDGAVCWEGSPADFLTKDILHLVYGGAVPLTMGL
jgi:iron complex transport system ATP-binding protein